MGDYFSELELTTRILNNPFDDSLRVSLEHLTRADLLLINNALNEVCNGVHIEDCEFQTRLGVSRDEARKLLCRIQEQLRLEFEFRRRAALEAFETRRKENASIGWREISDEEVVKGLFDRFGALFRDGKLCVSAPSVTWDVSGTTGLPYRSPQQLSLIDDLHRKCLAALKRCTLDRAPWYVLENYNHPVYQLHVDEMPDHIDGWPVEVLPYADPCYLLAPDFSSGIIATLRDSITVFGHQLLAAVKENLPLVFTDMVRSDVPDRFT